MLISVAGALINCNFPHRFAFGTFQGRKSKDNHLCQAQTKNLLNYLVQVDLENAH